MFQRLYDWTLRLANHRHAIPAMAAISFAESSFFPIPPDVVIVPMILARRSQTEQLMFGGARTRFWPKDGPGRMLRYEMLAPCARVPFNCRLTSAMVNARKSIAVPK